MRTTILLATAAALIAAPASAVVIDFDSLGNNVVVTNQFAEATFSSTGGRVIRTTAQALGSSLPNFICTGFSVIDCVGEVVVDFTNPVSNLNFLAVGDNDVGVNGRAEIFAGAASIGVEDIVGDGIGRTPFLVDFGAASGITRLVISNVTDFAGLGYDDFTFDVGGDVPAPAALVLFGLGVASLGALRRR